MSVLALDTSSRARAAAALVSPAGAVQRSELIDGRRLDTDLARLLPELTAGHLDAVVVVTGPGSYTGLRAGMAAALGVAQARGLPLHGVGALEVVAAGSRSIRWVARDAGRGAAYAARPRADGTRAAPLRLTLDELRERCAGQPVASTDPLPLERLVLVDQVAALAASVPYALTTSALELIGLSATTVE